MLVTGEPSRTATWNDYGEGTIIQPTLEFGSRDLETLSSGPATQALRLPGRLFGLRKAGVNPALAAPIASEFFQGRDADAERKLKRPEQN